MSERGVAILADAEAIADLIAYLVNDLATPVKRAVVPAYGP